MVPRRSVCQLGQIDAEHMVKELFGSLLRPVRRTDPVAEPHSGRIGKLQCDADAPGLPDQVIGASPTPRLVITQSGLGRRVPTQRVGKDNRVLDGLAGALAKIGVVA
jgi:hypothetical protein